MADPEPGRDGGGGDVIGLIVDPADGRILDATPMAGEFYGHGVAALRIMRVYDLSTLPAAVVLSRMTATSNAECGWLHRSVHRLATGETRTVDVVAWPIVHAGRRVIRLLVNDVSAHIDSMAERNLLAAAVQQVGESVLITDLDGSIVYVNPAFERVTGYTRAEVVGRNPGMFKSGAVPPDVYEAMWQQLTTGHTWTGEFINLRKDRSLLMEEATITPVYDEDDGLLYYVGVKRDVTRERAERSTKDHLAAIVESAVDAAYAVALDGTVLAWNESAARLYGRAIETVIGRSIYDVVPTDEHDRLRELAADVQQGAVVGPFDASHRDASGAEVSLSITASPVRGLGGGISGMAAIARDVTAERLLAREHALLEAQLRQAQKMEAIGRFAGGIAHDFNNLLTAIRGYGSLVAERLDGPLLDDQREILRAADRAADLSRRLLAFSRSAPVDPRPVAIDEVLEDSYRMVSRLVPERLVFTLQTGAARHVVADPVELEQILLNLVVNAVDATPGAGEIRVETRIVQDGPGLAPGGRPHVLMTVRDSGAGMDEDTRSRIFEPFFTTKGEGEGTGLGLATVYAIVARSGGTVSVDSTLGGGTTFSIWLPVAEPLGPVPQPESPREPRRGGHVLLLEDSRVVRDLATRVLEEAGFRVSNGEPTRVLAEGPGDVDVIVTDVVMPGLSGPELVRQLGVEIPVVFMSGYPASLLPADLALHPGRRFLAKPFTGPDLIDAVTEVLPPGERSSGDAPDRDDGRGPVPR